MSEGYILPLTAKIISEGIRKGYYLERVERFKDGKKIGHDFSITNLKIKREASFFYSEKDENNIEGLVECLNKVFRRLEHDEERILEQQKSKRRS